MDNKKLEQTYCQISQEAKVISQTTKFDQLKKYVRNIFLCKSCGKCGSKTTPDLFVFFLKKLYMTLNQAVSILYSICFRSPQFGHTIKTYCMKLQTVDPETC